MSKALLTICSLLACSSLAAQPILTAGNTSPVAGDQIYYFYTGYYPTGDSGEGRHWNFAGIPYTNSRTYDIKPCAAATMCGAFPGSNLASLTNNSDTYLRSTPDSLAIVGAWNYLARPPQELFLNPRTALRFPLTYRSAYVDSFYSIQRHDSTKLERYGSDSTLADGWGDVSVRWVTATGVLRLHKVITTLGRLTDTLHNTVKLYHSREDTYAWYKPEYHEFIIAMTSISTDFPGRAPYSTSGAYTEMSDRSYVSTTVPGAATSIATLLQNPATDRLRLQLKDTYTGPLSYAITDASGRRVVQGITTVSGRMIEISLAGLRSGLYFCTLSSETGDRASLRFLKD